MRQFGHFFKVIFTVFEVNYFDSPDLNEQSCRNIFITTDLNRQTLTIKINF